MSSTRWTDASSPGWGLERNRRRRTAWAGASLLALWLALWVVFLLGVVAPAARWSAANAHGNGNGLALAPERELP